MKKSMNKPDPYAAALAYTVASDWKRALIALKSLEHLDFSAVTLQEIVVRFGASKSSSSIAWLHEQGANLNRLYRGSSALHAAIFVGAPPRFVSDLLDHGAELELRNGQSQTPLLFAAYRTSTLGGGTMKPALFRIAKVLLARGANPNVVDNIAMSALDFVCQARDEKMAALLFKSGALITSGWEQGGFALGALANLSTRLLKLALSQTTFSTDALTQALVTAVVWGKLDNAKLLVKSGADLHRGDPRANESFTVIAARSKSKEMIAWVKQSLAKSAK